MIIQIMNPQPKTAFAMAAAFDGIVSHLLFELSFLASFIMIILSIIMGVISLILHQNE